MQPSTLAAPTGRGPVHLRATLLGAALLASAMSFGQGQVPEAKVFLERARQALESNPNLAYSPSTMLVRFAPSASESVRQSARKALGGPLIEKIGLVPGLEVVGTQVEPRLAAQVLKGLPGVLYAEPDYTVRATLTPNDTHFGLLWGLNQTNDADIDAPEAWDISTGSSSFVVADIDTGVLYTHADLAANMWKNPGEIAGNGIDDEGNGRVDDVYGWDFANNDNNPIDDHGHGTHTSGTIGAVGNNGIGVTGVCWNVKIMALKFLTSSGSGSTSAAVSCLNYAVSKGVKVSNNSWGGGGSSQSLYDAINASKSVGHLFVAAAGNNGTNNDSSPFFPASYNLDNIISVASTTSSDARSSFSNYGATSVDLGAPGSSIYSTVLNGGYGYSSGTSMASPHVAGVAALLYAYRPTWSYSQVRSALFATARPISALAGITVTGGVVNAGAALAYGGTPSNNPPVVSISSPGNGSTFAQGASITFSGNATDESGNLSGNLTWSSSINGGFGAGEAFTYSSLSAGTHVITASATDPAGLTGSASVTITVQSPNQPPAAPSNQKATRSNGGALITWSDNSNNETGFQIERETRTGNNWISAGVIASPGANATSHFDSPGRGQHRYRIRAVNANGVSAWTGWAQVKL